MNLSEELKGRLLVEHSSAQIEKILSEPRTVYLGIDPTSDSMQVGNLAVILLMKRLGDAGNKLIFLVGGGTGLIGDPKETGERPMLDELSHVSMNHHTRPPMSFLSLFQKSIRLFLTPTNSMSQS